MRAGKARWIIAAAVCVGAIVFMVTQLGANLNYLEPVSVAVEQRESRGDRQLRIGGVVKPGTLSERAGGGSTFELTDGDATIAVDLPGAPHQTVTDNPDGCVPVVVEGHWQGETFAGDRMILRHGAEYDDAKHDIGDVQDRLDCERSVADSEAASDLPSDEG